MSLAQALSASVAGLRANQVGMSVLAANVANADTPGYIRKTPIQIATAAGRSGVSVRVDGINRQLDQYVQRQLRVEMAGAYYATTRNDFYERLQGLYGVPGSDSALSAIFDDFSTSLQALSASPDSPAARSAVLSAAQVLAQQLNSMSTDVQGLRSDAEQGLSDAVRSANDAMKRIGEINRQLGTSNANDATAAALKDERDRYIDQLSQLMDITVVPSDYNQVAVFTNSGIQLVGIEAATLRFDAKGSMTPASEWSVDPNKRAVGTITLVSAAGGDVDLISNKSIRSGTIAAYLEMRDSILVEAQTQLDQIAAAMASALSDRTVGGDVVSGVQAGFEVDIGSLLAGNTIHLSYTDNLTGAQKSITFMRVDDPSALPLSNDVTPNPNDRVIGINFAGGMASVVSQMTSALGTTGLSFSNAGSVLRIVDDGATNRVDVDALSATHTVTSLTGGTEEFPFFLDASSVYTGVIRSTGSQSIGLAGRIAVNANLLADPTRLVVFNTSPATAAGDPARPNFIFDRLTGNSLEYMPSSGIGTRLAPYTGSLPSFIRQVIGQQGDAAAAATMLRDGQEVVLNSLRERFNDDSAVNVDTEMANLLSLQNSYAANARVMSTIKEMIETLMRM